MYRGDLVEFGPTAKVLGTPEHPYTRSLISAVPRSDRKLDRFPLVSYIEEAKELKPLDVKSHWLGRAKITANTQAAVKSRKRQSTFCDQRFAV